MLLGDTVDKDSCEPAMSDASFPSLAPALLVSMPQLNDPNFHRSVILLCEHGKEGAFGLVLNRRTGTRAASVVRLTPPVETDSGLDLWIGGPVEIYSVIMVPLLLVLRQARSFCVLSPRRRTLETYAFARHP